MADGDALRQRRRRMHAAGDHGLCKRCAAVTGRPGRRRPVSDPVAVLRQLAADALADYAVNRGNAMLIREARMTLVALIEAADAKPQDNELERLFADLDADRSPATVGHT